jgi:hypothetical protein
LCVPACAPSSGLQKYFKPDYVFLYSIAPNIQTAFEALSKPIVESREDIKARIAGAEKA